MPRVSVVIPCYNQGQYIEDAVNSVLNQTYTDFEIIIVNDGSTDVLTNQKLAEYTSDIIKVIHTRNQGLPSARNTGISMAQGEYILPLDADDKIAREYLELAVPILDNHPDIGIVYCEAAYFGELSGIWYLPEYSVEKILFNNIIFCTAFFRKYQWKKTGGYNINMVYGWEDWDFWLSLIELGLKVYRIPRVLFYYRIHKTSMARNVTPEKEFYTKLHAQINHRDLYRNNGEIVVHAKIAQLWIDTGLGYNENQAISTVIFGEERVLEFDLTRISGIKGLRFDPINDYAVIRLHRIVIYRPDGTSYDLTRYSANDSWRQDDIFIFDTSDPQILFDLDDYVIGKIVFYLDYVSVVITYHPFLLV